MKIESKFFQILKTSKLIEAAITLPIIAYGKNSKLTEQLKKFSQTLGNVYQLQDDYMDRYNPSSLGREFSSDLLNHKTTSANLQSQENIEQIIQKQYLLNEKYINKIKDYCIKTYQHVFDERAIDGLIIINQKLSQRHCFEKLLKSKIEK